MTDNTETLPPLPERDSLPGLVRLIAMLGLYALALESKDERI